MTIISRVLVLLPGLVLVGCSAFGGSQPGKAVTGEPVQTSKPATTPATAQDKVDLPDVSLTPELLYKLLSAEMDASWMLPSLCAASAK